MTSKRKFWALGAMLLASPAPAFATGGLGCTIDDKNLKLDFEAVFSYSDIGGLFQVSGELQPLDGRTYTTLRKIELSGADLKQQWFRDRMLKLMLYRETEGDGVPFAAVKLIIEATQPDGEEFAYTGKYRLTVEPASDASESQAFTVDGTVACSAG
jgi:hypothetical protein